MTEKENAHLSSVALSCLSSSLSVLFYKRKNRLTSFCMATNLQRLLPPLSGEAPFFLLYSFFVLFAAGCVHLIKKDSFHMVWLLLFRKKENKKKTFSRRQTESRLPSSLPYSDFHSTRAEALSEWRLWCEGAAAQSRARRASPNGSTWCHTCVQPSRST